MRPQTACTRCRYRRRRCVTTEGKGPGCETCTASGFPCSNAQASSEASDSNLLSSPSASLAANLAILLPDKSLCNDLVDLYFDIMHDTQHTLFHRPTFVAEQREGRAPMMLVLAMMALAARFSIHPYFDNTDHWNRGRLWAEASKSLFDARTEAVSITSAQACSLLSILAFIEGDMGTESLYGALAIRMVLLLGLPKRLSPDPIQRETEIRLWWSTWMMDKWTSAGARLPKQLVAEASYPRPMEEIAFGRLSTDSALNDNYDEVGPANIRSDGLWCQMIPLTEVLAQIAALHESIVQSKISRQQNYEIIQSISEKLDSWLFRLPLGLQNTPENFDRYREQGLARTFAALHIGFHHHCQLLYYQFLHPSEVASADARLDHLYATRCKHHATELSKLLWKANTSPGCECLWVITGHLLAISSSVHLHSLLFEQNESQIEAAKEMLQQNFQLMIELRKYWPSLDFSMSRLRAFHRAVQEGMSASFAMDNWMLIFLQRYMQPVEDKSGITVDDEGGTIWSFTEPTFDSHEQLWYSADTAGSGFDVLQSFL